MTNKDMIDQVNSLLDEKTGNPKYCQVRVHLTRTEYGQYENEVEIYYHESEIFKGSTFKEAFEKLEAFLDNTECPIEELEIEETL